MYTRESGTNLHERYLGQRKRRIILPKSIFSTLDRMNQILVKSGSDKDWMAEEYVKTQLEKEHTNEQENN